MPVSFESVLAKTRLFSRLSNDDLGKFAAHVVGRSYKAGQVITKEGDLGTGLFIITSGAVDVIIDREGPNKQTVATLKEGEVFGEMALLLENPRSATIVATEATECFTLVRWDFKSLATDSPELLWNMLEIMAERVAESDKSVEAGL